MVLFLLTQVSFRHDDDLEQVREIPCRAIHSDTDSDSDTEIKTKTRVVHRKPQRQLSPAYHLTGAFPARRPKSVQPSKSSDVKSRLKPVKSAPPCNQGRLRSQNKGKFLVVDRSVKNGHKVNKTNTDKQVPALLSPLLHINSKTIISRKRTHKSPVDSIPRQRTPVEGEDSDIHTPCPSPAFSKCNMSSDRDTDAYAASQRMNAWHIANTCDISQMHQPDIVPLWE